MVLLLPFFSNEQRRQRVSSLFGCRLFDVLHSDRKLTLVFEYCDQDLSKYISSCKGEPEMEAVKVRTVTFL